jgi:hypothetical protein
MSSPEGDVYGCMFMCVCGCVCALPRELLRLERQEPEAGQMLGQALGLISWHRARRHCSRRQLRLVWKGGWGQRHGVILGKLLLSEARPLHLRVIWDSHPVVRLMVVSPRTWLWFLLFSFKNTTSIKQ